jgi:hypothetical protein
VLEVRLVDIVTGAEVEELLAEVMTGPLVLGVDDPTLDVVPQELINNSDGEDVECTVLVVDENGTNRSAGAGRSRKRLTWKNCKIRLYAALRCTGNLNDDSA